MFALIGYSFHLIWVAIQMTLAAFLIVSGGLSLVVRGPEAQQLEAKGMIATNRPLLEGNLRLFLGVALLLPAVLGVHYFVSAGAALIVTLYLLFQWRYGSRPLLSISHLVGSTVLVLSVLTFALMLWEGDDLVALGGRLLSKARHYQQLEADWHETQEKIAPNVGDLAPDFRLADPAATEFVQLSDFRGQKPVLLLFGAHT